MKKAKIFLMILLMIFIALGGSGCMNKSSTGNQIEMAENLLNEKYNQTFCVNAIGERFGTLTNNTYKVQCYPVESPDDIFIAEVDKQGNNIYDDYISVCVCQKLKKSIKENLNDDTEILVESRPSITEETNSDISVEEFAENNDADFVVYAVTKEKYDSFNEKFDSIATINNSINIELRVYSSKSDEQLKKFKELSQKSNQMNSEIKFLLDDVPQIIKYEKGVVRG